jgi:hypothetical protein
MSSLTYNNEKTFRFIKKGVKTTIKEKIFDGDKGLSVSYLKKEGDTFYKVYIKEIEKDKYSMEEVDGDKKNNKEINEKDLLKLLKTLKLDDYVNYITKERGTYKGKKVSKIVNKKSKLSEIDIDLMGGAKKKYSKKSSKKSSKKNSKKTK